MAEANIDWDAILENDFVEDSENEEEYASSDDGEKTDNDDKRQELATPELMDVCSSLSRKQEIPRTNVKYSITNLHQDGEGLFRKSPEEMISDPFNRIKQSQHGPSIVLCAESVLQKQNLCALQLFISILDKLWKAATAGDLRVSPASQREKMWQAFHMLCSNSEFVSEFEVYLSPALGNLMQVPSCKLFVQSLSRKWFEKIILVKNKADVSSVKDSPKESPMTNVEENILRYAAGFVPFSLRRQCMKRQENSDEYAQKTKCLGALEVENENEQAESFLEYTKCWIRKENRGGLFNLSDDGYLFFRAVERHCGKYFNKNLFVLNHESADIRLPVLDAVFNDEVALKHWANVTKGHNSTVSVQVMQMCVKLWVNIRGHAFARSWIEQFKQSQAAEATKNKALRKNLKSMSNPETHK